MPLKWLILQVPAGFAEPVSDALLEAGAQSVALEDAHAGTPSERAVYAEPGAEAGAQASASWTAIRVLLDGEADESAFAALALQACAPAGTPAAGAPAAAAPPADVPRVDELPAAASHGEVPHAGAPVMPAGAGLPEGQCLAYRVETVPDDDWVRASQSQFEPLEAAPGIWVVPSWREPVVADAINIRIDPGLAFGTGAHATTQLCMRWLSHRVTPGCSVMDYGCGSGILAIAAAKLGATRVRGVDVDPDALSAAADNARRNQVSASFLRATDTALGHFDLLVANILANPLRLLAPALAALVRPGGRVALSGILETQADELSLVYEPYFAMRLFAAQDGWICLEGLRR